MLLTPFCCYLPVLGDVPLVDGLHFLHNVRISCDMLLDLPEDGSCLQFRTTTSSCLCKKNPLSMYHNLQKN